MANLTAKTSSNIFYKARCEAATHNEQLSSREGAADYMSIDRGRLYRIESGIAVPYPEEIRLMADLYNAPELENYYCRTMCPLGSEIPKAELVDMDRITIRTLSTFRKIGETKEMLGIHHGKFPKYIQNEVLRLFNNGTFEYLFCTSTIIEGVNTNAKNVVIINNSVGNTSMTAFALKNIKGRAGRYYHHSMGRVFYTNLEQRRVEMEDEMKLNFKTYDDNDILNVDIDNSEVDDLSEKNKVIKLERERKFNRILLPDRTFIKNRLYPRDVQEKYLKYIKQSNVFGRFIGLIENYGNINYILKNRIIDAILDTFEKVQILDENKAKVYYHVISLYSRERTIGILKYQVDKIQEKGLMAEEGMDGAYIEAFGQIRNIVEYEVPKLLCLFEALFQRAAVLLGYNMDDFNMSTIIRFFELGITTELGLFLVEYGFPTDTIRILERRYPVIGKMGAIEAVNFLTNNPKIIYSIMDKYEQELYKRAVQALVRRK